MNPRTRLVMLLVAFAVLAWPVLSLARALPAFGYPTALYGQTINALMPFMRHVANMVTVVNFDVRGFDTLGEEMMLVAATTGTVMLLRGSRGESTTDRADMRPGRPVRLRSDAVSVASRIFAVVLTVYGLYIVAQGTETPGGGFQAGVILSTAFLLVYLGEGYAGWRTIIRGPAMAALEGAGGLIFVLAAAVPLALGYAALENILPLGQIKSLIAGGMMQVGNWAVTFAVAGGFASVMLEFMEETREPEEATEQDC